MSNNSKDEILEIVTRFYLDSRDFNGLPIAVLEANLGIKWVDVQEVIGELIEEDLVGVLFSDIEMNTHILRTGFAPDKVQISKLGTRDFYHTCIYPRPKNLENVVDRSRYENEPYKLYLALGEPQLAFRSFDLSVLEFYRNDPRYLYENDDISGHISIRDEYFQSGMMAERDQILLETFGFSYDQDLNRAVAAFIGYLSRLSPEHQQNWKTKELKGDFKLHPDYYRHAIIGDWGIGVPILTGLLKELNLLNQMATAMERPVLFRQDFGEYGECRPQKLCFLVRPTLDEFNNFILLVDKLLSDNINKDFFRGEVSDEIETQRKDGKIVVQSKGTLLMLDEWIRKYFKTDNWKPWDDSIAVLRDVRKLRQKPAHAIDENVFDQRYFKEQRELIIKVYSAISTLRLMFARHPKVRAANIKIPDWLDEGKMWTY